MKGNFPLRIASSFLWIGFVGAISFMEAWIKFQAPGITLGLGLGIGRLVFQALNYMEWLFVILILLDLFRNKENPIQKKQWTLLVPILILFLQTIWLLPALDARAELIISGENPEESLLHFYYVALEIIKISCLSIHGFKLLK
jgi:hypothetical protein